MKLKIPSIIIVVVLAWGFTGHAMSLDGALDVVQGKYRSLDTLSAKFTQTTRLKLLNKNVTTTGTLQLKKPGKMRIEYDDANGKSYISNGKNLWVLDRATKTIDTYKIGSSEIPKEALTFLNGFGDIRETFGVATWSAGKKSEIQLQLVPQKPTTYTALDATFSSQGILHKLTIHNRSGNVSHYTFSAIQENPSLPDSQFESAK